MAKAKLVPAGKSRSHRPALAAALPDERKWREAAHEECPSETIPLLEAARQLIIGGDSVLDHTQRTALEVLQTIATDFAVSRDAGLPYPPRLVRALKDAARGLDKTRDPKAFWGAQRDDTRARRARAVAIVTSAGGRVADGADSKLAARALLRELGYECDAGFQRWLDGDAVEDIADGLAERWSPAPKRYRGLGSASLLAKWIRLHANPGILGFKASAAHDSIRKQLDRAHREVYETAAQPRDLPDSRPRKRAKRRAKISLRDAAE